MTYYNNNKKEMRPQHFHQKLLEPRNTFIKVVRYKINTQKSIAFLFINDKDTTKEIETKNLTHIILKS